MQNSFVFVLEVKILYWNDSQYTIMSMSSGYVHLVIFQFEM